MPKMNAFHQMKSETKNINKVPKSNSNEYKTFKSNGTKIKMKHPIYATKHNKNKKASDEKNTYSSVRITTDTSIKLHALLKASGYQNRNQLINKMIHLSKPTLLNNSTKLNKYKKTYQLIKDFKAKAKKL